MLTRESVSTGSVNTSTACWTRRALSSFSATPRCAYLSHSQPRAMVSLEHGRGRSRSSVQALNRTRWVADGARQIDYLVIPLSPSPAELVSRYSKATGLPPMLPEWASGFWQCKLRYRSQHELLEVACEHKRLAQFSLSPSSSITSIGLAKASGDSIPPEPPDPQAMADLGDFLREVGSRAHGFYLANP